MAHLPSSTVVAPWPDWAGLFRAGVSRTGGSEVRPVPSRARDTAAATDPEAALEQSWIDLARGGDEQAFRRLVDRHRDRAYRLALRIVRTTGDAEEVAQDAFVRAWRALPDFRGDAAFTTWLHRIVVRRALDRVEVLARRRAHETALEGTPEPPAAAEATSREPDAVARDNRLEALIAELTPMQRACVTLFYLNDRSVADVARVLEIPENTVKTHLSRARAALRAAWTAPELA